MKPMEVNQDGGNANSKLAIIALCFKVIGEMSINQAANYILTFLSILSVSLIIIINWKKAMDVLFKKKRKK